MEISLMMKKKKMNNIHQQQQEKFGKNETIPATSETKKETIQAPTVL